MLFYVQKDFTSEGYEGFEELGVQNLWLMSTEVLPLTSIQPNMMQLLNYVNAAQYVKDNAYSIQVAKMPFYNVPVITVEDVGVIESLDVTSYFDFITQCLENSVNLTDAISFIKEQNEADDISGVSVEKLVDTIYKLIDYLKQPKYEGIVNFGFEFYHKDFIEITGSFCKTVADANANPFKHMTLQENKTLFQEKATDELFIRLPLPSDFTGEDTSYDKLIPSIDKVVRPYSNAEAYKPTYKENTVKVPVSMYPLIEGVPANNKLDVQDNEKRFYQALLDWFCFNYERANHAELKVFASPDEPIQVLDKDTMDYISHLITVIYSWHWGHNPSVPVLYNPEDISGNSLDDDNDEKETDDISRVYSMSVDSANEKLIDACDVLLSFLQTASMKLGCWVYADAIIKLLRWGERKGTALILNGYPQMFMFGDDTIRAVIGDISEYEVELIDGCQCELFSVITDDSIHHDTNMFGCAVWDVPVGVTCCTNLKNKTNPEERTTMYTYYSFIDFIREIALGNLTVAGVSLNGKVITADADELPSYSISTLINSFNANKDRFMNNPFFSGVSLKDFYLQLHADSSSGLRNHFTIMQALSVDANLHQHVQDESFNSIEELKQKLQSFIITGKGTAIDMKIFSEILPIYKYANSEYVKVSNASFQDVLQIWLDAMITYDYVDEMKHFQDRVSEAQSIRKLLGMPVEEQQPKEEVTNNMSSLTAFSSEQQVVQAESPKIVLYRQPSSDAVIAKIVDFQDKLICYCAVEVRVANGKKQKVFTILPLNYLETHPDIKPVEKPFNVVDLFTRFIINYTIIANGSYDKVKLFYLDNTTAVDFKNAIDESVKKRG